MLLYTRIIDHATLLFH